MNESQLEAFADYVRSYVRDAYLQHQETLENNIQKRASICSLMPLLMISSVSFSVSLKRSFVLMRLCATIIPAQLSEPSMSIVKTF